MDEQAGGERDVTLEEAMAMGVFFQKRGQLAEAAEVYRRVLAALPDHPDALHFSGVLAHQQGRSAEAVSLIERSLALEPGRAEWCNNLGLALKAQGRLAEAEGAYRRAIALAPDHANAHSNLGVTLRALSRLAEAEEAYRAAIRLDPGHVDAYHNLALLLQAAGRLEEAVVCWCKVGTLSPRHPATRRSLAWAYCTLGQPEKAVEIYEQWLRDEPGNPSAEHMLAACSGRGVPARASDAYIEANYDTFAATFEERLEHLSYRAPALVAAMLAESGAEAAKALDVVDVGCGTGLCGPHLAPYARRLTGVDLSAAMLAKAGGKQVYDELVKQELTAFLRERPAAFDLIVSADTLCYFGALEEVAAAAAAALRPGGTLVFSVEELVDAAPEATFTLPFTGRYRHALHYVEGVLANERLDPRITRVELRMEGGAPVKGLVVRASKPRGD
jgi:predicted TPR repeat methyltransferase